MKFPLITKFFLGKENYSKKKLNRKFFYHQLYNDDFRNEVKRACETK